MNYVVCQLIPKHFVYPPVGFRCCPNCGGMLSKSEISPSKAVTHFLTIATIGYCEFSNLYECPACHWWAVWECFGDAECSFHAHYLLTSLEGDNQSSRDKPWSQALEDENIYNRRLSLDGTLYDRDMPLPKSIEQVLIDGKKRIIDLPTPGDKVCLVGDVHVLQDEREREFVPLFIEGSEGTVVSEDELYASIKPLHQNPTYARNHLIRIKSIIEKMNCCPIRLEKLKVSNSRRHHNTCEEGKIYFIDAADIKKME